MKRFEASFGEAGRCYVTGLRNQAGPNLYWHLKEILQYQELYGSEAVASAIEECLSFGAYHKNSVRRLLEGKKLQTPVEFNPAVVNYPRVNIKRTLSCYSQGVLSGE